jgi:hypothetical protein
MSIEKIIEEVDNYNLTLQSLIALGEHLRYKSKNKVTYYIGKKMRTSSSNKISPKNNVTPDEIIQLDKNSGLVVEAKINFSRSETDTSMSNCCDQLLKYDDNLFGWDTPNKRVKTHEISLLTHMSRTTQISNFLKNKLKKFSRTVNIIEFSRNDQRKSFIFLRDYWGSSKYDHEDLKNGVNVGHEHLIPMVDNIKFYDVEPPLALLLEVLWQNIFSAMITDEQYRQSGGRRSIEINVTLDMLSSKLKAFSPDFEGASKIPSRKSIENAMDKLISIDFARRESDESYTIRFHKIRGEKNVLEYFAEKLEEPKQTTINQHIKKE